MNKEGMDILRKYKDDLSALDIAKTHVQYLVTVNLNENQVSALESFVLCRGAGALRRSALLRRVNQIIYSPEKMVFEAAKQFMHPQWSTVNGKRLGKLKKRREMEANLFRKPVLIKNAKE